MNEAAIVLAVGRRGCGKTTKIRELATRCRRALILDPEKKWEPDPGDELVEGGQALLARLAELDAGNPRHAFRIVYRDNEVDTVMPTAGLGAAFAYRHLTLVMDELALFCHANYLPPYMRKLLAYGRERRVNLLGTTRQPQEIHNFFFDQADLIYFFHVEPGLGLDRIRKYWGKERAERICQLGEHEHVPYVPYNGGEAILDWLGREGLDNPKPGKPSSRRTRRRAGAVPH